MAQKKKAKAPAKPAKKSAPARAKAAKPPARPNKLKASSPKASPAKSAAKTKPPSKLSEHTKRKTPTLSPTKVKAAFAPKTAAPSSAPATETTKSVAASPPAVSAPLPPQKVTSPTPKFGRAKSALRRQRPTASAAAGAAPSAKPEKSRARKFSIDISANEAAGALAAKWTTLFKRADHIDAKPYDMNAVFEERTAIVHKVLGWGYILANRNDRLEVLFKDGIKYLISNYKP